jgi:hypothetical protein
MAGVGLSLREFSEGNQEEKMRKKIWLGTAGDDEDKFVSAHPIKPQIRNRYLNRWDSYIPEVVMSRGILICRKYFPLPASQLPRHGTEDLVEVEIEARVVKSQVPKRSGKGKDRPARRGTKKAVAAR